MFDGGSAVPVVDEVITGGTSGHYGTVVSVELESGSWATSTADGRLELKDVSGVNEDREAFTNNETLTGSSGATMTADQKGWEQVYGILRPDSEIILASDGHWYCQAHNHMRFDSKGIDEAKIDVSEEGRIIP